MVVVVVVMVFVVGIGYPILVVGGVEGRRERMPACSWGSCGEGLVVWRRGLAAIEARRDGFATHRQVRAGSCEFVCLYRSEVLGAVARPVRVVMMLQGPAKPAPATSFEDLKCSLEVTQARRG